MSPLMQVILGLNFLGGGAVGIISSASLLLSPENVYVFKYGVLVRGEVLIGFTLFFSLFLVSIATGVALIKKRTSSLYWACGLLLLQTPYIESSFINYWFGSGGLLRVWSDGNIYFGFGGDFALDHLAGNGDSKYGINFFSLAVLGYLLRAIQVNRKFT